MKKQEREDKRVQEELTDEEQLIREFANPNSNQPVPQPKDFEEIEY